jgi:hypothetical protein
MTDYQQAESMIQNERAWNDLFRLFPTKLAAYEYFGRSMAQRFGSPTDFCVVCGRSCDAPPMKFVWRTNLHTAKTIFVSFIFSAVALFTQHLYSRWLVVKFATIHRLCLECQHRHRVRTIVIAVANKILFAALILLLVLTVPMAVFFIAAPFVVREALVPLAIGLFIGLGLLVLIAKGFEACRRAIIPQSLRQIGRFPFFLYELQKTT